MCEVGLSTGGLNDPRDRESNKSKALKRRRLNCIPCLQPRNGRMISAIIEELFWLRTDEKELRSPDGKVCGFPAPFRIHILGTTAVSFRRRKRESDSLPVSFGGAAISVYGDSTDVKSPVGNTTSLQKKEITEVASHCERLGRI